MIVSFLWLLPGLLLLLCVCGLLLPPLPDSWNSKFAKNIDLVKLLVVKHIAYMAVLTKLGVGTHRGHYAENVYQ